MRRRFLLLILLLSLLSGCGGQDPLPRSLYDRFAEVYPLEAGVLYDSEAKRSDPEYLDPLLLSTLLRRSDGSYDGEDIALAVLYLGAKADLHRELLILRCHSRDSAREVAALCVARAELLDESVGTEARVLLSGKTVVLLALSDNAAAERLLRRMLD